MDRSSAFSQHEWQMLEGKNTQRPVGNGAGIDG